MPINTRLHRIKKMVDNFSELTYSNFQPWSVFNDWEQGETKRIGKTLNTLTYKGDNRLELHTEMGPGSEFPKHWHNFNEELEILSGTYTDKLNGITRKTGETVTYGIGEVHKPINIHEDTLTIRVVFTR